jgi:hypothetical protein
MSMQADVEKLMAQLFTDRASRERFVADPASAAKEAGLSAEETEAVLRIDVRDLLTAEANFCCATGGARGGVDAPDHGASQDTAFNMRCTCRTAATTNSGRMRNAKM